jgi:ribosome-associated protein
MIAEFAFWAVRKTGDGTLSDFASADAELRAGPSPSPQDAASEVPSDILLAHVLASLDEDKAEEVISIDLRGRSAFADHMVIASGRSTRQVAAIAEKLTERLKRDLGLICKVEGREVADWVLIDAGDVVVHIFRPEVRSFYQLEKMWQSAAMPRPPATAPALPG